MSAGGYARDDEALSLTRARDGAKLVMKYVSTRISSRSSTLTSGKSVVIIKKS